MAGALHNFMVYMGLAEDPEDVGGEREAVTDNRREHLRSAGVKELRESPRSNPSVRAVPADAEEAPHPHGSHSSGERETAPAERRGEVAHLHRRSPAPVSAKDAVKDQEVGPMNRITTIHPRTYNEAKVIGEAFREGVPVIMNLGDMPDDDAKRLVDFAAGLVFGLAGTIERVTSKVFLLSPAHIEVDSDQGPHEPGKSLFNQS